jgi:hypothetical protein
MRLATPPESLKSKSKKTMENDKNSENKTTRKLKR